MPREQPLSCRCCDPCSHPAQRSPLLSPCSCLSPARSPSGSAARQGSPSPPPERESSPCHFIPFIPSFAVPCRICRLHWMCSVSTLGILQSNHRRCWFPQAAPSRVQHPAEPPKSQQRRRRCWHFCCGFLLQHRGSTAESGADDFLPSPRVQLLLCSASPTTGTTKIIYRLSPTGMPARANSSCRHRTAP